MIDQPSLAIIIDCWESTNTNKHRSLFDRILFFLENNDSIKTVVLATYNSKHVKTHYWNTRYHELFTKSKLRKIRDLSYVHYKNNEEFNEFPEEITHPIISYYYNDKKDQLIMHWPWELEYYLSIHPEIKNVYVLGQAWEMCVKVRPLGYETLQEIENINILTNSKCVLTNELIEPDLNNTPEWNHVIDNIWKYNRE